MGDGYQFAQDQSSALEIASSGALKATGKSADWKKARSMKASAPDVNDKIGDLG